MRKKEDQNDQGDMMRYTSIVLLFFLIFVNHSVLISYADISLTNEASGPLYYEYCTLRISNFITRYDFVSKFCNISGGYKEYFIIDYSNSDFLFSNNSCHSLFFEIRGRPDNTFSRIIIDNIFFDSVIGLSTDFVSIENNTFTDSSFVDYNSINPHLFNNTYINHCKFYYESSSGSCIYNDHRELKILSNEICTLYIDSQSFLISNNSFSLLVDSLFATKDFVKWFSYAYVARNLYGAYINGSIDSWRDYLIDLHFLPDLDLDGIPDVQDSDLDGDGYLNITDAFPADPLEWCDTDHDGIGDNTDLDDDGDGWSDIVELNSGTDPIDPDSMPPDLDLDGIPDPLDDDQDGDGVLDLVDAFPQDPTEWNDTDLDGIGDNSDTDIDGDLWNNTIELQVGTDLFDLNDFPADLDGDLVPDALDDDQDGDGVLDLVDQFPQDPTEWNDTDQDELGDNTDPDIDGDGYLNNVDISPWDPQIWKIPDSVQPPGPGLDQNGTLPPDTSSVPSDSPSFWGRHWRLIFFIVCGSLLLIVIVCAFFLVRRTSVPSGYRIDHSSLELVQPEIIPPPRNKRQLHHDLAHVLPPPSPMPGYTLPPNPELQLAYVAPQLTQSVPAQTRHGYAPRDKHARDNRAPDEHVVPVLPLRKRTRPVARMPVEQSDDAQKILPAGPDN